MVVALSLAGLALGLAACGLYGRERVWEKMRGADVALGEVGRVRLPEKMQMETNETVETGDAASYSFRRMNDTHINGTTSYAEFLKITIFAGDAPMEPVEAGAQGRWEWRVKPALYEQHPVREDVWQLVLLDRERRVRIEWQGFQKQYTVELAKRNLQYLAGAVAAEAGRADYFRARRDWPEATWKDNYAANLRALETPMVPGVWQKQGPWFLAISNERPQRLVVAYRLGEARREGPVDFNGPVTRYALIDKHIWQDNQGSGGAMLPMELVEGLRGEFPERETNYFYTVQTENLWKPLENGLVERMKARAREMDREYSAGRLVVEAKRR